MEYNLDNAVNYHYDQFPPSSINYEFFIQELLHATETLARFDQMLKNLYEEMKMEFSDLLSSKWSLICLDFIFTNPVFRNNKFVSNTKIPAATAGSIVKKLIDKGYLRLKEEAAGRRPALYSFEP